MRSSVNLYFNLKKMCIYMLLHLVKMQNYHFQALSFPPKLFTHTWKKKHRHMSASLSRWWSLFPLHCALCDGGVSSDKDSRRKQWAVWGVISAPGPERKRGEVVPRIPTLPSGVSGMCNDASSSDCGSVQKTKSRLFSFPKQHACYQCC